MRHLFSLCLLLLFSSLGISADSHSYLMLEITYQKNNYDHPWQRHGTRVRKAVGSYLEGNLILTTADAVKYAKSIEFTHRTTYKKHELRVTRVDLESNLALLKPDSRETLAGYLPVNLANKSAPNNKAKIVNISKENKIEIYSSSILGAKVRRSSTGGHSFTSFKLKTNKKNLGHAEPVLSQKGELLGIISKKNKENTFAIPFFRIKNFLRIHQSNSDIGFPSLGVIFRPLSLGSYRKGFLRLKTDTGVEIVTVLSQGPFHQKIRPGDILTHVDQKEISWKGTFRDKIWGELSISALLNKKLSSDQIELSILRRGKKHIFRGPLAKMDSNMRPITYFHRDGDIPHIVVGGYVLLELSKDYLKSWGKTWWENAPSRFLDLWNNPNFKTPDQKVVFISAVLADDINKGYDSIKNAIVTKINGTSIKNIKDVKTALGNHISTQGGRFIKIELSNRHGEIIIATDELKKAHQRLTKNYEVPQDSLFNGP